MGYYIRWLLDESGRQYDNATIKAATQGAKKDLGNFGQKSLNDVLATFDQHAKRLGIASGMRSKLAEDPTNRHLNGLSVITVGLSLKGSAVQNGIDVAMVDITPIRKVWFTPFPCMLQDCLKAAQDRAGLAVEQTGQFQSPKTTPLAKYGKDIILVVVGHCDRTGGELSCDCGKHGIFGGGLDAYSLNERLGQDGLDQNVKEIRLFACKGADLMTGAAKPYAQDYANSAANFFPQASVYGYSGFLLMGATGKKYSYVDRGDDTTKSMAKSKIRPFTAKAP